MQRKDVTILGVLLLAVVSRVIPHPPNFTAITAIGLFSAAMVSNRWLALVIPAMAMLLGDILLGFMVESGLTAGWMVSTSGVYKGSPYLYLIVTLITLMGWILRDNVKPVSVYAMSILGSLMFFSLSNFYVWLNGYPHTTQGLVACYVAAVPFLQWTVLGDLFYTSLLFLPMLMNYRLGKRVLAQVN